MSRGSAICLFAVLSSGCAGKYPMESARRSLLLPDGEHQIVAEVGKYRELRPFNVAPKNDWRLNVGYRYGVSDRVNYYFPLLWSHGWKFDGGLELVALGGISGLGYGSARQRVFSGDPREPNAIARGMTYTPSAGGAGRLELSPELSLLARTDFSVTIFMIRPGAASFSLRSALIYDLHPYWSAGVGLSAGISRDWDETGVDPWIRLGRGAAALGDTPLIAFHLARGLDLTASPFLEYEFTEDELHVGVDFGVDWYFD